MLVVEFDQKDAMTEAYTHYTTAHHDASDGTDNLTSHLTSAFGSNCKDGALLGPLGLLVQLLLALLAFSALIVKRFCEPKNIRRSWRTWFYDTSKQAVGASVIHFANVFLANVFDGDPCTWYFVSFLLDSSIGLLIIYCGLKVFQILAIRKNWQSLMFGDYGNPPNCRAWVGQCLVYIAVMVIEKGLMTLLILPNFWAKVRQYLLSWIGNPDLELILVMFVVPLLVNALVFWVVDNVLKKNIQKNVNVRVDGDGQTYKKLLKPSAVRQLRYYDEVSSTAADDSDGLWSCDDDEAFEMKPPPRNFRNADKEDDEKCALVT